MANSKNRCTGCKNYFPAESMIVVVAGKFHSQECLIEYGLKKTDSVIKKAKVNKKKVNSRKKREYYDNDKSHQEKKAIIACNRYIVARDGKICISCGTTDSSRRYSAGHYKTAGAFPELRFHPDNIHSQCWWDCNKNRSGNIVEYRPRLLLKIGVRRLEYLEGPHERQKYTIDDYRDIADWYRYLLKELNSHVPENGARPEPSETQFIEDWRCGGVPE